VKRSEAFYPEGALIRYEGSLSATATWQKRLPQQCLEAETLKGVIDESVDASLDYFLSKKNVVKGDLKDHTRQGGW